jgi:hypothetical protein
MEMQTEILSELFLLHGLLFVNLVAEDDERHGLELLHLKKRVELKLGLSDSFVICRVDNEDNAVELAAVLAPSLPCLLVTPEVIGVESDVADGDLGLVGVDRRISLGEAVTLQHVEQGGLASVVKAQKDDIGALLEEAQPLKGGLEEVQHEHFSSECD